jgi:hypothetical protein
VSYNKYINRIKANKAKSKEWETVVESRPGWGKTYKNKRTVPIEHPISPKESYKKKSCDFTFTNFFNTNYNTTCVTTENNKDLESNKLRVRIILTN